MNEQPKLHNAWAVMLFLRLLSQDETVRLQPPPQDKKIMIRTLLANALADVTDRKGVTAAEYAVMATGIVALVAVAALALGGRISAAFAGLTL